MQTPNEQTNSPEVTVPVATLPHEMPLSSVAEVQPPPDEKAQWLDTNAPPIKSFLAQEPTAREGVERILNEYLGDPPTADTYNTLLSALQIFAGEKAGQSLLAALFPRSDDPELFERLVDRLTERDRAWLRLLMAAYGKKIGEAWVLGTELPDDWRGMNREIYFSLYAGRWIIRTEIVKYDGTKFLIEARPGSHTQLISLLLRSLSELPPDALKEAIDLSILQEIANFSQNLLNIVTRQMLRPQLVDTILKIPEAANRKTRTHWLTEISSGQITREPSDSAADLKTIIDQLDDMGQINKGKHSGQWALPVFIDNVLSCIPEDSDVAEQLQKIQQALSQTYN